MFNFEWFSLSGPPRLRMTKASMPEIQSLGSADRLRCNVDHLPFRRIGGIFCACFRVFLAEKPLEEREKTGGSIDLDLATHPLFLVPLEMSFSCLKKAVGLRTAWDLTSIPWFQRPVLSSLVGRNGGQAASLPADGGTGGKSLVRLGDLLEAKDFGVCGCAFGRVSAKSDAF